MPHPSLANAELAVMQLLWDAQGPLTARQIREQLYPGSDKAQHGTVQRLLQRLDGKGFLVRDSRLPVHLFEPAFPRAEYAGEQLEALAERLTGGSLAALMTHLVEHKRIAPREIARLRDVLDGSRRARARS